jgi:hypothetical protein
MRLSLVLAIPPSTLLPHPLATLER